MLVRDTGIEIVILANPSAIGLPAPIACLAAYTSNSIARTQVDIPRIANHTQALLLHVYCMRRGDEGSGLWHEAVEGLGASANASRRVDTRPAMSAPTTGSTRHRRRSPPRWTPKGGSPTDAARSTGSYGHRLPRQHRSKQSVPPRSSSVTTPSGG